MSISTRRARKLRAYVTYRRERKRVLEAGILPEWYIQAMNKRGWK